MPEGGMTTGLKLWLFFLLSLYLLGYSIPLSIFFGALGGLAGGLYYSWWNRGTTRSPRSPEVLGLVRNRIERWQQQRGSWGFFGWRPFRAPQSVYKRRADSMTANSRRREPESPSNISS